MESTTIVKDDAYINENNQSESGGSAVETTPWVVKFEDKPNRRTVLFPDLFEKKQAGDILFTLTPKKSEKETIFKNEKVMVTVLAIDL